MNQSVGQFLDGQTDFWDKATWLAVKTTKQFLEIHMDASARRQLQIYQDRNCVQVFYKAFFQKHACVFGHEGPAVVWNCRNPSACVVYVLWDLQRLAVEEDRL